MQICLTPKIIFKFYSIRFNQKFFDKIIWLVLTMNYAQFKAFGFCVDCVNIVREFFAISEISVIQYGTEWSVPG